MTLWDVYRLYTRLRRQAEARGAPTPSLTNERHYDREVREEPTHLNDSSLCNDPRHPHADLLCILRKKA